MDCRLPGYWFGGPLPGLAERPDALHDRPMALPPHTLLLLPRPSRLVLGHPGVGQLWAQEVGPRRQTTRLHGCHATVTGHRSIQSTGRQQAPPVPPMQKARPLEACVGPRTFLLGQPAVPVPPALLPLQCRRLGREARPPRHPTVHHLPPHVIAEQPTRPAPVDLPNNQQVVDPFGQEVSDVQWIGRAHVRTHLFLSSLARARATRLRQLRPAHVSLPMRKPRTRWPTKRPGSAPVGPTSLPFIPGFCWDAAVGGALFRRWLCRHGASTRRAPPTSVRKESGDWHHLLKGQVRMVVGPTGEDGDGPYR